MQAKEGTPSLPNPHSTPSSIVDSPAPPALQKFRGEIVTLAAQATKRRLDAERAVYNAYQEADIDQLKKRLEPSPLLELQLAGTEAGFARPVSAIAASASHTYAADWSGQVYEIDVVQMVRSKSAQFGAGMTCLAPSRHGLYSGNDHITLSNDLEITASVAVGTRVAGLDEHPHLDAVVAACYDHSFKVYDTCTSQLVQDQKTSHQPIHTAKIHPDGALVCAAGLDSVARIWDLRSGQPVLELAKHHKEIYTADWHPNGYNLATAGADCTVYEWDVRNKREHMLPAHTSVVTCVRYECDLLLSSSYDCTIKVWRDQKVQAVHQLTDKVLSFACVGTGRRLVAGKKDCTVEFLA